MAKHPYQDLIEAFDQIPGIGPKAAQRMTDACLKYKLRDESSGSNDGLAVGLQLALQQAMSRLQYCPTCQYLMLDNACGQCDSTPGQSIAYWVVETIEQANTITAANSNVRFFVLHGVISPTAGIGPQQLHIGRVVEWLSHISASSNKADPIIINFLLPDSIEGQITMDFIQRSINKVRDDIECRLRSTKELQAVLVNSPEGST